MNNTCPLLILYERTATGGKGRQLALIADPHEFMRLYMSQVSAGTRSSTKSSDPVLAMQSEKVVPCGAITSVEFIEYRQRGPLN